jgi:hypothetical protein
LIFVRSLGAISGILLSCRENLTDWEKASRESAAASRMAIPDAPQNSV